MDFRIQQTTGLLTLPGLLMLSPKTEVNGMIPMMTVTVTTSNTSMVKPSEMPTVATVARPPKVLPPSTDGAAQTATKTGGLTPQMLGLQARVAVATHGRWIQLNGMISMVMDAGTTHEGQPPMYALIKQAPQSALPQAATAGAVLTLMAMAGRTLAMHSSMNRPNGEIQMAMATAIEKTGTRAMHVQKCAALPCLTALAAATLMVTVGRIRQHRGKLTRREPQTPSQQRPCNGKTLMVMDSVMCHLVPSGMTVLSRLVPPSAMYKGVLIQTTMVGRMSMADSPQPLPFSVRILKPHG